MVYAILGLLGALISRWHGGDFQRVSFPKWFPKGVTKLLNLPKSYRNIAWALPFGILTYIVASQYTTQVASSIFGVLSTGVCIAGKATGHGRIWNPYLPMEHHIEPEVIEEPPFMKLFKKRISNFWYKTIALGVSGFVAVAGAALFIGIFNPIWGLLLALGGISGKVLGYLIGWKQSLVKEGNAFGEVFTGAVSFLGIGIVHHLLNN